MNKFAMIAGLVGILACGGVDEGDEAEFGEVEQAVNVPVSSTPVGGVQLARTSYGGKFGSFTLVQQKLNQYGTGNNAVVVPSTKAITIGINISDAAPEKLNAQSSMQGACNQLKGLISGGGHTCSVIDREGTGCASSDLVCVNLGSAGSGSITDVKDMRRWVSVSPTSCTVQTATPAFTTDSTPREAKVCARYNVQLNFNGIQARTDLTEPQKTALKVYTSRHGLAITAFGVGSVSQDTSFQVNGSKITTIPVTPVVNPFFQPQDVCQAKNYNPTLGFAASWFIPAGSGC